ncbi:MAG: hypothetical protein GEU86_11815 [Actinophytocola sp.]|nr:hypothetical protein [Actinophytocola sp.]
MISALRGARGCVTQLAPLTERILEQCPELELFAVGRGGPVNVNLDAAARHGVTVTSAPGRNATATAEHTIAMILAAVRRIPGVHSELKQAVWRGDYYQYDQVGIELSRACVGLVGYGAIGKRVAKTLKGFGVRVLVTDPYIAADALTDVDESVGLLDYDAVCDALDSGHKVYYGQFDDDARLGLTYHRARPRREVLLPGSLGHVAAQDALPTP